MEETIITVIKIIGLKRLENSINGNPNYQINTYNGCVTTENDAMENYKIYSGMIGRIAEIKWFYNEEEKPTLKTIRVLED